MRDWNDRNMLTELKYTLYIKHIWWYQSFIYPPTDAPVSCLKKQY